MSGTHVLANAQGLKVLTVGGHEVAFIHFFSVTKVWLHLFPAGVKPPPMDSAGLDVQHIKTGLPKTKHYSLDIVCLFIFSLSRESWH